eukprot:1207133-Prymnesium_polylepis.1
MPERARCAASPAVEGGRVSPLHPAQSTCSPAIVPAPVTDLMADSEQDDMFKDAVDSAAPITAH